MLEVKAYTSTESKEFQKHFNAVAFCLENELSFPKETSKFFKGKLGGDDLEDIKPEYILDYIKHGIEVPFKTNWLILKEQTEIKIKVSEIPSGVDLIVVTLAE